MIRKILSIPPIAIINAFHNRIINTISKPRWHKIKAGYLKNISIYVNIKTNLLFKNMVDGKYDNFIYKDSKSFKGKVVWDVGAHIGFHSLGFAKVVGEGGVVIAFEPNTDNIRRMEKNLSKNPILKSRIKILTIALSDKKSRSSFITTSRVDTGRSSGGFMEDGEPPLDQNVYYDFVKTTINSDKADNLVFDKKTPPPDILKIDVEGFEGKVLEGAKKMLKKYKPRIYMEVHHITAMLEVTKILHHLGYILEIQDDDQTTTSRCFVKAVYEG